MTADADTSNADKKHSLTAREDGRDRYIDMVRRERVLLSEQGISRSTEQLLVQAAGALDSGDNEEAIRDTTTGDQLRAVLPVQSWMPLSIHLVALESGLLKIAPLHDLNERQVETLISTVRRSGFHVEDVESELWDRAELLETLRRVHDLAADRCEKTLSTWLADIDNGLLLNQFMRDMMAEALQMRASDIHLVQDNAPESPNWIKYRVDGDLIPMHLLPAEAMARLTTLLKRDAGLNFGDRITPKDGRFGFTWQGRAIDVRVAAGPQGQDGEKLTLRLLDRAALKSFDDLFRRYENVGEHLSHLLDPSFKGEGGFILMSGPTGSGKSTTMYAAVQRIDRRRRHVLTIEDPIEYEVRYATQWQVGQGSNSTEFPDLIRAAMRHDPDYIVIGEMRDGETVETALRAAESGHTVISTIHADSAVQTLERLRSFMPVEREKAATYTLAQQIRAILNQRLVKTLCQGCASKAKAGDVLEDVDLKLLDLSPEHEVRLHNPNGCDLCSRSGFLGRTLLLEALLFSGSENSRETVFQSISREIHTVLEAPGVKLYRRADGLRQLVHDGWIGPKVALEQLRNLEGVAD